MKKCTCYDTMEEVIGKNTFSSENQNITGHCKKKVIKAKTRTPHTAETNVFCIPYKQKSVGQKYCLGYAANTQKLSDTSSL